MATLNPGIATEPIVNVETLLRLIAYAGVLSPELQIQEQAQAQAQESWSVS